jgi:hypothetical protein
MTGLKRQQSQQMQAGSVAGMVFQDLPISPLSLGQAPGPVLTGSGGELLLQDLNGESGRINHRSTIAELVLWIYMHDLCNTMKSLFLAKVA